MDAQTRKRIAIGLLAAGSGITALVVASRIVPKIMRKMMRAMMRSMMKEMERGEGGFNPPEM